MAEDTGGEKSLPASPTKKRKAKEEGNIAKSQDLSAAAALTAALIALSMIAPVTLETFIMAGRYFLGHTSEIVVTQETLRPLTMTTLYFVGRCVLPFMAVMLIVGILMNLLQVGFNFTSKPLKPKLDRLDIVKGFKKFGSPRTFVEGAKSVGKLCIVGVVVYLSMRTRMPEVIMMMHLTPYAFLLAGAGLVAAVWWRIAVAMIVLGILDYGFQRWQHERDLRMTQQEAKEEMKELEGDPKVKQRIRQLQRQMAAQRMMLEVPEADVIITNPTHYAVALRYDMRNMEAPRLVAKGARLIAEKIRDIATENDVPIVQNPELARGIYRTLEVGDAIPEDLFHTVAEVLSYVYTIDRRVAKQNERKGYINTMRKAV